MHVGVYSNKARVPSREGELKVYIGTNVEYAPYVEMGHINAKSGRHVPAQPFIRPALLDHIQEWKQDFITIVREEMKEELEHKRGKFTDDDN
jgi:phage gpG-like protein